MLALDGCTTPCIPCHFREVWHREIDMESIQAVLEDDMMETQLPVPNGETMREITREICNPPYRQSVMVWVPDGIMAKISAFAFNTDSNFIARYLDYRYAGSTGITWSVSTINELLCQIDDQWTTDAGGNPVANPHVSGHHIGSLPTTPVTPRNNGRPRSSHRIPPPMYSPARPNDPRAVLAPLALLEAQSHPLRQQTPPPSYASLARPPPPSYDVEADANNLLDSLEELLPPAMHVQPPYTGPIRERLPRQRPRTLNRARRPPPIQTTFPTPESEAVRREGRPHGQIRPPPQSTVAPVGTMLATDFLEMTRTPHRSIPEFITSPNTWSAQCFEQPRLVMRDSPFDDEFPSYPVYPPHSLLPRSIRRGSLENDFPDGEMEDSPTTPTAFSPYIQSPLDLFHMAFPSELRPQNPSTTDDQLYTPIQQIPFPDPPEEPTPFIPTTWYTTSTSPNHSLRYGPTNSEPFSSEEEEEEEESSPTNFLNYRRRQAGVRRRQRQRSPTTLAHQAQERVRQREHAANRWPVRQEPRSSPEDP